MRLQPPPTELVELASGVDGLYLSGLGVLPELLVDDLTAARDEARASGSEVPLELGEETFRVSGGGLLKYPFRLEHRYGVMALTTSASLPAVRIQPRAAFLHGIGVDAAMRWFRTLVESFMGQVQWKVSRLDLFMDSHGWGLHAEDRGRFVCRAKQRITYEDRSLLTGFRFGKSGAVMARIYDKTEEIRAKRTDWWVEKWGSGYRPGERVLRVEFQLGRGFIRQAQLDTPEEVLDHLPKMWGYLTDDWLTYRNPTEDATRSRWPIAAEWQEVQGASLRGSAVGLDRVYKSEVAASLTRLVPPLRGYLASAGALVGAQSLDETLHRVGRLLVMDEERSGVPFAGRILDKRAAWGVA